MGFDLFDNQILFNLLQLNEGVVVNENEIECLTSIGAYKNLIGDFVLRSQRVHTFSFQVISALTFKIGVVERSQVDQIRAKNETMNGAFSNFEGGFAIFSQGFKRHKNSDINKNSKIFKAFVPGDVVSVVFDSIKGVISFYVNQEFRGVLFVDEKFKNEEFYPAIAILGEGEKVKLTYFN